MLAMTALGLATIITSAPSSPPLPNPSAPTAILSYSHYGNVRLVKAFGWLVGVVLAVLIVAARKHYTVDVVIAWYVVPMVYVVMHQLWGVALLGGVLVRSSSGHVRSASGGSAVVDGWPVAGAGGKGAYVLQRYQEEMDLAGFDEQVGRWL